MSFSFDVQKALASGVFISGTSGAGKTNLAKLLADKLIQSGVRVYVFDPSQSWLDSGLQVMSITRTDPNLTFPKYASIVFDISLLRVKEQRAFIENFCREFFTQQVQSRERIQTFLVFEEAQLYLGQATMMSKAAMEIMRIISTGRNYKIRYGLITPFASNVDKLPIKMTQQRYFGYSDELNDKKYLHGFLKGTEEYLDQLKVGEFFYNTQGQVTKIQVPEFKPTHRQIITFPESQPITVQTQHSNPNLEFAEPEMPRIWTILAVLAGVLWFALIVVSYWLFKRAVNLSFLLPLLMVKKKRTRRTRHHRMPDGKLVVCE